MNSVQLIGNLTRDIELKVFNTGAKVARFSIAVNRKRKNANGQYEDETCFIEVETWGRTAEVVSEFLKKGSKIGVSGYLKQESWTEKDGAKRSKHIVILEKLDFLDTKAGNESPAPQPQQIQQVQQVQQPQKPTQSEPPIIEIDDEYIPF